MNVRALVYVCVGWVAGRICNLCDWIQPLKRNVGKWDTLEPVKLAKNNSKSNMRNLWQLRRLLLVAPTTAASASDAFKSKTIRNNESHEIPIIPRNRIVVLWHFRKKNYLFHQNEIPIAGTTNKLSRLIKFSVFLWNYGGFESVGNLYFSCDSFLGTTAMSSLYQIRRVCTYTGKFSRFHCSNFIRSYRMGLILILPRPHIHGRKRNSLNSPKRKNFNEKGNNTGGTTKMVQAWLFQKQIHTSSTEQKLFVSCQRASQKWLCKLGWHKRTITERGRWFMDTIADMMESVVCALCSTLTRSPYAMAQHCPGYD